MKSSRRKTPSPKRKTFYITTPIYYVNDVPHIGHAYTTIAADVLARYKRLRGYDVFFLTGTDEHGQKVQQAASKQGLDPQTHADRMVVAFKELWKRLTISNDDFVRTTEERHKRVVQEVLRRLRKSEVLYKASYQGWYCLPDERFWADDEVVEGKCPECGRPVERISESNYFFKMSAYRDRLMRHIRKYPGFIRPENRRNEVLGFLDRPLEDLCISRPRARLAWGIPFPFDPDYVTYVWVDALVNYISVPGYGTDKRRFAKWWPADVHLVGKDILTTHAVYWSTLLMALGLDLPKTLFAHGWWTVDGEKMSKSRGNVVDPNTMAAEYGTDAFRYFLLREVPFGQDGNFSKMAVTARYNSELANDLGNLFSRTLTMIERYSGGAVPKNHPKARQAEDRRLAALARSLYRTAGKEMERFAFHRALREIWTLVDFANRYVERTAPWDLAKDPKNRARLDAVLYHLAETLRILAIHLFPFMPGTAQRMTTELGWTTSLERVLKPRDYHWGRLKPGRPIQKGKLLFPRIETPRTVPERETAAPQKLSKETAMESTQTAPSFVSIDEFRRLDLRVGRIITAEKIAGADKLLKLSVSIGAETRQVVAGIATKYGPEQLIGRSIILVANLKPAVIRGIESQGMILAAGDKAVEALATFMEPVDPGTRVK
ncbi:MAG TPA: methionine--tRNA ligase [Nitrospiria bacterium]|nr:methionine--tRNA ligase [Nitrospiria bacterium]HUK57258.1 methionine--tRNA ligase [Nitrospiria bacterium]